MTWLNWSLKLHSRLRTIPHLVHTHNTQVWCSMNIYFICMIVHVQMWCVCAQSYMDQTKKIFDRFICIWKCFSSLFVFKFCTYFVFQCFKLIFMLKNRGQSLSRVVRNLAASHETEKCIFSIFGHQTETFTSSSRVSH